MLESSSFRRPFRSQRVNVSQTLMKPCAAAILPKFSYNLRQIQLEKITFSQIWNLKTVFSHVDGISHVFSSELREFPATSSNAIIFKIINILSNFYCILEICIKFYAF